MQSYKRTNGQIELQMKKSSRKENVVEEFEEEKNSVYGAQSETHVITEGYFGRQQERKEEKYGF